MIFHCDEVLPKNRLKILHVARFFGSPEADVIVRACFETLRVSSCGRIMSFWGLPPTQFRAEVGTVGV